MKGLTMTWDQVEGNWKEFSGKVQLSGASSAITILMLSKAAAPN
jgi:hypothetical protein